MELKNVLEEIWAKPVVPLWPHAAMVLGVSRGGIYAAAARNEIEVIRIGRSIKVVTSALRKQLGIDRGA
jgi:excisionase family DNA binding protein